MGGRNVAIQYENSLLPGARHVGLSHSGTDLAAVLGQLRGLAYSYEWLLMASTGRNAVGALLLACAAALPGWASAQVAFEADVEMLPGGNIAPGGTSLWRLSMTNTGLIAIDTPVAGTNFIEVGSGKTITLHAVPETAPCTISYTDVYLPATQQVQIFADVFFADSPLPIDGTSSCVVGITIDSAAPNYFVQEFGFQGGTGVAAVNRRVDIPFLLGPLSTPIPVLWPFGLVILGAGVLLIANSKLRARN